RFSMRNAIHGHGLPPLGQRDDDELIAIPQRAWINFAGVEDCKCRRGRAGLCRSIDGMLLQGKFMGKDERTACGFFHSDNASGKLHDSTIEDVRSEEHTSELQSRFD